MCKDKSGRPILIDFGLSVDTTNIMTKEVNAREIFFSYVNSYVPWCLDITMITYLINKGKNVDVKQENENAWRNEKITIDEAKGVIRDYAEKNVLMNEIITKGRER